MMLELFIAFCSDPHRVSGVRHPNQSRHRTYAKVYSASLDGAVSAALIAIPAVGQSIMISAVLSFRLLLLRGGDMLIISRLLARFDRRSGGRPMHCCRSADAGPDRGSDVGSGNPSS